MFLPSLMGQGTPEQQEEWVPRAYNNQVLGTYAQVIPTHIALILKFLANPH